MVLKSFKRLEIRLRETVKDNAKDLNLHSVFPMTDERLAGAQVAFVCRRTYVIPRRGGFLLLSVQ